MAVQAVWLDCDPGHDDAMAILLAGYSPALQLLGVSTVASNQVVEKTTRNALDMLDLIGLTHIGVVMGQAKPLLRPAALLCPEIHGETGLDGPQGGPVLPHSGRQALPGKAAIVMFEAIQQHYGRQPQQRVQLVCTGALTNAALLLLLYPEVAGMIEITIMGGALGVGNTGPVQEFNIQVDPEAARVVFEAGVPLTMVPLEVTHTALATPEVLGRMFSRGGAGSISPFKALVELLLTFFASTYKDVFGFHGGAPLHDPCAIAAVIAPSIFKFELMRVDIETVSPLAAGQTVCDIWHQSSAPKNCRVAREMDVDAFWELMLAAVDATDLAAPMNKPQPAPEAAAAQEA
uniref:Inosine/uridine-preferring nucleoside hydrolase domain-containing protein n=1 Tax=Tetradesmus obliquus TaxID=3088 RepID=A0A383V2J0_TETOB|eukprot:jgi/Sobl393_1/11763/SZX59788.1